MDPLNLKRLDFAIYSGLALHQLKKTAVKYNSILRTEDETPQLN